jgi:hypothetical protein
MNEKVLAEMIAELLEEERWLWPRNVRQPERKLPRVQRTRGAGRMKQRFYSTMNPTN